MKLLGSMQTFLEGLVEVAVAHAEGRTLPITVRPPWRPPAKLLRATLLPGFAFLGVYRAFQITLK